MKRRLVSVVPTGEAMDPALNEIASAADEVADDQRRVARLGRVLALGLSEEGESRRQIGRRLGVSHQRVSAILTGRVDVKVTRTR